jgi:hypothetical protein
MCEAPGGSLSEDVHVIIALRDDYFALLAEFQGGGMGVLLNVG